MDVKMVPGWKSRLAEEFEKPYFNSLIDFVKQEYKIQTVYPPGKKSLTHSIVVSFRCKSCDHRSGSVPWARSGEWTLLFRERRRQLPPSLLNIFKEIRDDLKKPIPASGDLSRWSKQGVLLLNATLTVRASSPGSHQNKGWETFTDAVIRKLATEREHVVFLLWGAYAQRKGEIIDRTKHMVLMSAHPSPFSADRGFFGCKHFSKANEYLKSKGLQEIDW